MRSLAKLIFSDLQNTDTRAMYDTSDEALRRHRQMVDEFMAGKRGRW